MSDNKSLSIIPKQLETAKKIDSIVKYVAEHASTNGFEKALIQSTAINAIGELLDSDYMKQVMPLQGTKIGFNTDNKIYDEKTVKACVIEAILNGLEVVGNHFNIIGGNAYFTKEGFEYLLKKQPNLWRDIIYEFPVLQADKDRAHCDVTIQWKINGGELKEKKIKIPVRLNKGMTSDAVLGKVERKAKKILYQEITGNDIGDGDALSVKTEDISYEDVTESKNSDDVVLEYKNKTELLEEEKIALDWALNAKDKEALEKRIVSVKEKYPNLDISSLTNKLAEWTKD